MKKSIKYSAVMVGCISILSQMAMPAFAGELTAEELYEKYAFTYDIRYDEDYGYHICSANSSQMTAEQTAEWLSLHEQVKTGNADIKELFSSELLNNNSHTNISENGFKYKVLNDNTIMVTGADYSVLAEKSPNEIMIPAEIDGKTVTAIGEKAFMDARHHMQTQKIQRIVLPDSVEYIFDSAFETAGTVYINLPKNVKYIGNRAFEGLSKALAATSTDGNTIELPESLECMADSALGIQCPSTNFTGESQYDSVRMKMPESLVFVPDIIGAEQINGADRTFKTYLDGNGDELVVGFTTEEYRAWAYTDGKVNAVSRLDALRHYIDVNEPDYSYADHYETIYVFPFATGLRQIVNDAREILDYQQEYMYPEKIVWLGDTPVYGTQSDVDAYEQFCADHTGDTVEIIDKYTIRQPDEPISRYKELFDEKMSNRIGAGDVNNDGKFTIADSVLLARLVAEDETASVSAQGLANADVNGDGELTSDDTTALLKMLSNN